MFPTAVTMARAAEASMFASTSHVFYVAGLDMPNGRRVYAATVHANNENVSEFASQIQLAQRFDSIAGFNVALKRFPSLRGLSLWAVQCGEQVK